MLLWPQVSVCSLGTISKFSIKFFMDSLSCEAAAGERASCEAAAGEGVSCEASCTVVRVVEVFRPAEPAANTSCTVVDSPSCEAAAGERASCEAAAGEGVSCEASCTVVRVVRVFRPAEPAAKVEVFWPEPAAKVVKEGGPKGAATPVIPCWGAVASRSNKKLLLRSLLYQGVSTKSATMGLQSSL